MGGGQGMFVSLVLSSTESGYLVCSFLCLTVSTIAHRLSSPHLVLLCGCGRLKPSTTGELPKIWGGIRYARPFCLISS